MCGVNDTHGGYAEMLAHWTDELAAGRSERLLGEVTAGNSDDVQRFLLNTIEERRRMLFEELAFVAVACDDFASLVTRYLQDVPRLTYDPNDSDSQRFLRWLKAAEQLSP